MCLEGKGHRIACMDASKIMHGKTMAHPAKRNPTEKQRVILLRRREVEACLQMMLAKAAIAREDTKSETRESEILR